MTEHLEKFGPVPANYAGHWPGEHYCLYEWVVNRGCIVDESNWHAICERLDVDPDDPPASPAAPVYEFVQRHWAVGRIRTLVVRSDAPDDILREADAIMKALHDYPVLDEDDYSERVSEAAQRYWDDLADWERAEYLAELDECERADAERLGDDYIPWRIRELVEEC